MEGATQVRAPAPGEAVTDLSWLCPGADALLALARKDAANGWAVVRHDPGAVLLVVRYTQAFLSFTPPFSPRSLQVPDFLDTVCRFLRSHPGQGFVDWNQEGIRPIYEAAVAYARVARHLAETTQTCDSEQAWVGGLLAPLGWLAACAVAPAAAAACLADPEHSRHPSIVQRRYWGLDQTALACRLGRRWDLPPWLAAMSACLGLPGDLASKFGVPSQLFSIVRAAVVLVQQQQGGLHLDVGLSPSEAVAALGMSSSSVEAMLSDDRDANGNGQASALTFRKPDSVALLPDLLTLAAQNWRLSGVCALRRLENEVDSLHEALRESSSNEAERLRAQKLNALAEFAAGAGHEINNPLAVISGQAQFLLSKLRTSRLRPLPQEERPEGVSGAGNGMAEASTGSVLQAADAEAALRKIVDQAQRIHQILRELMLFARPARPNRDIFDLGDLVREVVTSLSDLATQRQVRLLFTPVEQPIILNADPSQVRTALTCLLRNAIEAAPVEGWASVRLETAATDHVDVILEDNGESPPPLQREHLFDPFYSGRSAGRGHGLGLPTAWRLAREHGGDVRLVSPPGAPTRFVLTLARSAAEPDQLGPGSKSGQSPVVPRLP
jgi:signal transduction histidine kinase